ncbi:MAG TPA: hypothetical protein VLZ55_00215, partial [Rhodanobacter sp.]|nr:hypothetical protein [Rhodanobacter sp.]
SLLSIHPGFIQNFGYGAKSRLPLVYSSVDNESFQYDANGNRMAQTGVLDTVSATSNRMGRAGGMTYYVNPEGQHLRKTGAAGTTHFAPGPDRESIFRAAISAWRAITAGYAVRAQYQLPQLTAAAAE